ncbi:hypothetical protein BTO32_15415 [Marinobacter lutaoensis]|uniref:Uncharacterized protein n=1 Tax=Marinobacter lutaoensis TaxID=135739 RepID=A0A1V2DPN5_9GAMM|nr:hypothetical protein BTO32_15415 [Marinobacter lutaoensis]
MALLVLAGAGLVIVSGTGSFVLLVMPWQARQSVENRIEITIRSNELEAIGRGRNSEVSQRQCASNDKLFSSDLNLVENPLHLREEVETLLYSLELRFKPLAEPSTNHY